MTANLTNIPRAEKLSIAAKIHDNLRERKKRGPGEPALDAFIPEIAAVVDGLQNHAAGHRLADAAHQSRVGRAEAADVEVDTWLRHIESFLHIEAHRKTGPNVSAARTLYDIACPEGLVHTDDRTVDENSHWRDTLSILKSPEYAPTVAAIELPAAWIEKFEAALDESDAAIDDVIKARDEKGSHFGKGRDAALAWLDLMVRLRRYVGRRARRAEVDRTTEGKALLKPLLDALAKLRASAGARANRRAVRGSTSLPPPPASGSSMPPP